MLFSWTKQSFYNRAKELTLINILMNSVSVLFSSIFYSYLLFSHQRDKSNISSKQLSELMCLKSNLLYLTQFIYLHNIKKNLVNDMNFSFLIVKCSSMQGTWTLQSALVYDTTVSYLKKKYVNLPLLMEYHYAKKRIMRYQFLQQC